jgi:hypothetical protein
MIHSLSVLKAISLPISVSCLLLATSNNTFAMPRTGNVDLDRLQNSVVELFSQSDDEELDEKERSREDTPDVIIDEDGNREPNDSSTSSDPEADEDSTTTSSNGTRFTCEMNNGEYTVMYNPESREGESYPWAVPRQMGGGWSAERRCDEISRRLESYRPDGLLEMRTAVENGYNTVCVTTQNVPSCRIVFTVPEGQDATITRDRVFENLTVADSGQQTQGVNTYTATGNRAGAESSQLGSLGQIGQLIGENLSKLAGRSQSSDAIDLRPFLDPADGGTGTKLSSMPTRPSSSPSQNLKPDNFR